MVMLSNSWQTVATAVRTPGAANVTYELQARINPQYHSIELNRDYVEIQVTYLMNVGYIYSGTWNFSATGCSDVSGGGRLDGSGTLISGGFWAYHDNSGNYSTSINANLSFYFSSADAYLGGYIELPNIPRASVPSWKNGKNRVKMDGNDTITLILDKKVASYRHSLVWVIGNSGYKWLNTNDIDMEYTFKPTEEMLKYSTDGKYIYGYLGVGTYTSGDPNATMIGSMNIAFFIDLPEEKYGPLIKNPSVNEYGNTNVQQDKVFRYLSKKKLSMKVETRGYSSIKSVYAVHNKQQFPFIQKEGIYTVNLEGLNDGDVQFVIEDSRGFKATHEWHGTYVPYFYPTITEFSAERDNPTVNSGYANAKGTFYNGENNILSIAIKDDDGHSANATGQVVGNEFSLHQRINGYSYDKNYNLTITITDRYGQSTEKSYVLTGNLWAMILGKLTASFHMIWVRRNGNNPCGIYNEGDTSTLGRTYAKGGLSIGGDDTFIVKEFTADVQAIKGQQAAYINVPYTIPTGYKLLCFYDAHTITWCITTIKSVTANAIMTHVYNWSTPNDITPKSKVVVSGLFVKSA